MPKGNIEPIKLNTKPYAKQHGQEPGGQGEWQFRSADGKKTFPAVPAKGNYVSACKKLHDEAAKGRVPSGKWDVLPEKRK